MVYCVFYFFRRWERLLLGDWARGEPNIFPLLAMPGEADLEQRWSPGFFMSPKVSLSISLCLTQTFPFFLTFCSIFSRVDTERYWGGVSLSRPFLRALNILHGVPRTHIFLYSINHLYGICCLSISTPLLHMDRAGNPLCGIYCSLFMCLCTFKGMRMW